MSLYSVIEGGFKFKKAVSRVLKQLSNQYRKVI